MTTQTHDIAGMCKEIADQQQEIARLQAQVDALAMALRDISAMTYDSWSNGAIAKEIADRAIAAVCR